MATVMAGFSVAHGATEYAVLQSVISNVSQNLMSASWASSWKTAIKHELPTIESFCERRNSPSRVTTSTVAGSSTSDRGSSKTQTAQGASRTKEGHPNGGTGASTTTITTTTIARGTGGSTTTTTTTISGGIGQPTTTTTTSNDPALLQQINAEFTQMSSAFFSWIDSPGTSAPVLSDGQQIQELLSQLSDSHDVSYCSDFSQDLEGFLNEAATLPAQDPLSDPQAPEYFQDDLATIAEDEHYCVFGSY